uniref:Uncharacterized protein n=1 Tax=Glossina palpalis gambiensis TaxID=67801 RepID=A0A1B0BAW3_9MUSC
MYASCVLGPMSCVSFSNLNLEAHKENASNIMLIIIIIKGPIIVIVGGWTGKEQINTMLIMLIPVSAQKPNENYKENENENEHENENVSDSLIYISMMYTI